MPTLSPDKVLKTRDALADYLFAGGFVGRRTTGEAFEALTETLAGMLPGRVPPSAVASSMVHVAGQPLTGPQAVELAWRLAANVPLLRQLCPVLPQTWRTEPHWAALQVMGVRPFIRYPDDKRRSRGAMLTFQVLTGPAASVAFTKFWSLDLSRFFARNAGFSAPWKKRPYSDEREITYFRLAAWLDPDLARDNLPGFRHMRVPGPMMSWNKDMILRRQRVTGAGECPRRFSGDILCHRCPAGQDECPAATHPITYTAGLCVRCGQRTWFDPSPDVPHPGVCVDCSQLIDLAIIKR